MSKPCPIRQFMSATVITLNPSDDLLDAIHKLVENRISGAPVLDGQGNLVGVLTERDCLKVTVSASYHGERAGKVSEYMSRTIETVEADASLLNVATLFQQNPYRRYPVMRDNRLVGIVSRRDVLRGLLALNEAG